MGQGMRLPAEPLKQELRRHLATQGASWDSLAARLGISSRTLLRLMAAQEVSPRIADRWAIRLSSHPSILWPHLWDAGEP